MSYLTIIQPDETFPYTPTLPSGEPSEAQIILRVIGDEQTRVLRKKHTKVEWVNGQRISNVDGLALAEDLIDAAIVRWSGVKDSRGTDVPCERAFKLLMPERIQLEVMRLCAGKEAGFSQHEAGVGGDEGKAV